MIDEITDKKIKYLILSLMKGIGPVTQNAMYDVCHNIDRWFEADPKDEIFSEASEMIGINQTYRILEHRNDGDIRAHAGEILQKSAAAGIEGSVPPALQTRANTRSATAAAVLPPPGRV